MNPKNGQEVQQNTANVGINQPKKDLRNPDSSSPTIDVEVQIKSQKRGKGVPSSTRIIDDNSPYRANGSTLDDDSIEVEEEEIPEVQEESPSWEQLTKEKYAEAAEKAKQTNKKVAKTAVKGVATYFGGPAGEAIADTANNSGVLDPVYDKIADTSAKVMDSNPLARQVQNKLNEADDSGALDAADSAISMIGGNAPSATKAATQATGAAKAGAQASTEAANATSNATSTTARSPRMGGNRQTPNAGAPEDTAAKTGDTASPDTGGKQKATSDNKKQAANRVSEAIQKKKEKKEKEKKKGRLINFLRSNPTLVVILLAAGLLALLFILLMALLLGEGGVLENYDSMTSNLDDRYDFTKTNVTLTNSYTNEQDRVQIQELMLEDLIKGAAYAELYNSLSGLTREQMVELFSSNMVVFRALALNIGKYDSTTKSIEIQSGDKGVPYCDITNGCDIVSSNGLITYLISSYNGTLKGSVTSSIPPASGDVLMALTEAYANTAYLILVPNTFDGVLTSYNFGNPPYNQTIRQNMVTKAKNNKKYDTIIKEISDYNNYKIYDLKSAVMSYSYGSSNNYWWPIGGSQDSSGLYSGTTSWTSISSPYGSRIHPISGKQSFHSGIDIPASQGTPIIATRSGTVTIATYNSSYGNYVEINHGDGTSSRYAHMMNGGILVKVGDTVRQGQIIGKVGTTGASTGNHLHFEIRIDGQTTNPTEYVSAQNQRPKEITTVVGVKGSNNTQSVCLTLKNAGFSNNAVAAIMSNMYRESNFKLTALGDHGTSYGLCQWHNGRYTNLRNYCGSRLNTVECQIDFLIYELKNSYKGVYNYLLSNNSANSMTSYFCIHFESPANKYVGCPQRANSYSASYLNYVNNGCR